MEDKGDIIETLPIDTKISLDDNSDDLKFMSTLFDGSKNPTKKEHKSPKCWSMVQVALFHMQKLKLPVAATLLVIFMGLQPVSDFFKKIGIQSKLAALSIKGMFVFVTCTILSYFANEKKILT